MEGKFINENLSLEWESGRFYGEKGWKGQRKKEEGISFDFWAIKQKTKREP